MENVVSDLETKRDGIKFDRHEVKGRNYRRRSQMVEEDGKVGYYDWRFVSGSRCWVVAEGWDLLGGGGRTMKRRE